MQIGSEKERMAAFLHALMLVWQIRLCLFATQYEVCLNGCQYGCFEIRIVHKFIGPKGRSYKDLLLRTLWTKSLWRRRKISESFSWFWHGRLQYVDISFENFGATRLSSDCKFGRSWDFNNLCNFAVHLENGLADVTFFVTCKNFITISDQNVGNYFINTLKILQSRLVIDCVDIISLKL